MHEYLFAIATKRIGDDMKPIFSTLAEKYRMKHSAEKVYPHYVLFCVFSNGDIKEYTLCTENMAMTYFDSLPSLYYGEFPDSVALYRVIPLTSMAGADLNFLKYKEYHRKYKYYTSLITNK